MEHRQTSTETPGQDLLAGRLSVVVPERPGHRLMSSTTRPSIAPVVILAKMSLIASIG